MRGRDRSKRSAAASAAFLLVCGVLAVPALAGDREVQKKIEARLAAAGLEQNAAIQVSVDDGVARLEGIAVTYLDYLKADRAARREARSVVNLIRLVLESKRPDRQIREDAEAEVLHWARYGPFDAVAVEVHDGVVVLQGWVDTPVKKSEIEERLAGLEGVRDVHNDLRLQGFSSSDRQLLQQIHERIYTDPLFERWAGDNDPPVRVFVSRGRVTLAGTVSSRVEKFAAAAIARGTLAFSVDDRLQVEGEARREEDSKKKTSEDEG